MSGHGGHKIPRTTVGWMLHDLKHELGENVGHGRSNVASHFLTWPISAPIRLINLYKNSRHKARLMREYGKMEERLHDFKPDLRLVDLAFGDLLKSKFHTAYEGKPFEANLIESARFRLYAVEALERKLKADKDKAAKAGKQLDMTNRLGEESLRALRQLADLQASLASEYVSLMGVTQREVMSEKGISEGTNKIHQGLLQNSSEFSALSAKHAQLLAMLEREFFKLTPEQIEGLPKHTIRK